MALLVRVLRNQISVSQWVPVCSRLLPLSLTQALSGTSQVMMVYCHQYFFNKKFSLRSMPLMRCCRMFSRVEDLERWPQMSQSLASGGSEQISGIDIQQSRKYHTTNKLSSTKDFPQPVEEKVGAFTKIIEAMGFTGPLKYSKWKIKIAALRMYTSCVKKTDFEEFFLRCQMPDTFNSWFLITLLHVWMCLVRMKQEGRTGKYMCRVIVHFMWEDVEHRGRVMGGILSDDHGLAAALWRTFFNQKCEDPRQLELLVEYVRKQIQYLDSMNGEDLLLTGEVSWRPLVEKNPQSVLKPHSPIYNDEGL
ncbi:ubiquinol-cytochrome-c reductase complex assembly factor 1 isoform X3 [Molossus molossus]|uniref:ubiquinol-cytochrome-c reductase complex assembly factor 1 isoform X3 n=1 Tax=Molossus molossus TaxID=27622 RepID=UPI00174750A5|nr:ubiquinol-cytochrome-c reductase complex assembly factor 1 isoform X3 [Molossus molossus]